MNFRSGTTLFDRACSGVLRQKIGEEQFAAAIGDARPLSKSPFYTDLSSHARLLQRKFEMGRRGGLIVNDQG
jgi:hypothetical protein